MLIETQITNNIIAKGQGVHNNYCDNSLGCVGEGLVKIHNQLVMIKTLLQLNVYAM